MESTLKLIVDKLENIENQLAIINGKIDKLERFHDTVYSSCEKMGTHVDFVESTYETLRYPLDVIRKQINYMTGKDDDAQLPQLKGLGSSIENGVSGM